MLWRKVGDGDEVHFGEVAMVRVIREAEGDLGLDIDTAERVRISRGEIRIGGDCLVVPCARVVVRQRGKRLGATVQHGGEMMLGLGAPGRIPIQHLTDDLG